MFDHVTQAPPTSQSEQNINRKAILGPDHLTVRELQQQCEWNTWPHASCERKEGKGEDGAVRTSQNHSRWAANCPVPKQLYHFPACIPGCWEHRRAPLCSRSYTCRLHPASACPSWRCLRPLVGCSHGDTADTLPPPSRPHTGDHRKGSSHRPGQLSPLGQEGREGVCVCRNTQWKLCLQHGHSYTHTCTHTYTVTHPITHLALWFTADGANCHQTCST